MKLNEIKKLIKSNPDICSLSLDVNKFPRWKCIWPLVAGTCQHFYIGDTAIFLHLRKTDG